MKIKAVLFDLDGVLVDATEWHYEALNRALGLFGYNIARYEHLTTYNGLPTRKKLEMLSVEKGFPRGLHTLVNKIKQKYTREEILRSCTPVFEKEFMVHQLKRDGYKLAVCSNSIRESVELMLRGSGIFDLFDFVLSNEDVTHAKPDPEIYLAAFQKLGVKAEEVIIVEDAPHGIEAAKRSGAQVCQVSGFTEVDYDRVKRALEGARG
ncbi:HAD family hydrolase [Pedosphaera parvula]|uniref:HAD-superfamily hydrolase, subfamily IA, variant 3 n=1 Tax=Pedosphaera parvula (strain Ellin514) TaxID=320771 RepID=B9XKS2_PEDPL|nr:HAD family phosphatase [Pedosphaera parvula]EEF59565.1 HAD-superfamily hydrolase, subfamily IA, variant 3 [Pedosphaera parvula Ellin514]